MNKKHQDFRPLTDAETEILEKLLSAKFSGNSELIVQLNGLQGSPIDSEGSLRFLVKAEGKANIPRGVVCEARYSDSELSDEAGAHVNLLLHVADGRLAILEIFKDDHSKILRKPKASELQVFSHLSP